MYCKTLPAGTYTIRVRAYNKKKFNTKIHSKYSESKSITVKQKETGLGFESSYDFSGVKDGDIIKFGAYEQDGNFYNGQEPIEWVVLKNSESQLFVVSKYMLDRLPYNKEDDDVTWETCTLRKWLNDNFYNAAFNNTEKDMINTTTVNNNVDSLDIAPGGNDTEDKVFLLSVFEAIESGYGYADTEDECDVKRRCAPTDYTIAREAYAYDLDEEDYMTEDGLGAGIWWLRSPGITPDRASYVDYDGAVFSVGFFVHDSWLDSEFYGVRPALVLNKF